MDKGLSVCIGKQICLENPIMPASGPIVGDDRKIRFLSEQGLGALVTKTISVRAAIVPRPCIIGGTDWIINTELWSEHPPERWENDFCPKIQDLRQPLFISLGYSQDEILSLIPRFEAFADAFELSTHYSGKDLGPIGQIVEKAAMATSKPVFIKISPHIPDPISFAQMVYQCGGYGIVATNSLGPVFPVNGKTGQSPLGSSDGFGWMSGPAIKPISLSVIRRIRDHSDIPIIGVGGISSAVDVLEFLAAGANAVQILSAAMLKGKQVYSRILQDLPKVMAKEGFDTLSKLVGSSHRQSQESYARNTPVFNNEICTLCMRCIDNCPYFALQIHEKRIHVDPNECFGCGLCESRCPVQAISGVLS